MPVIDIRPVGDASLDHTQVSVVAIENCVLLESEDRRLHVIGVTKTQGISSGLHVAQVISSEGTSLPQNLVLDGKMEEQLKPKTDDGAVKVKADKENMCLDNEPTVKERSADTKKSDHKVKVCEDVPSIKCIKSKGKISKSSSSSSESSSSDSDRD